MLLSVVLFVLILAGCWLYLLIDAALTPAAEFRGMPKAAWIGVIVATFIVGAIAWLAFRATSRPGSSRAGLSRAGLSRHRPSRHRWSSRHRSRMAPWFSTGHRATPAHTYVYWYPDPAAANASFARHPAGRSRKTPADGWPRPKGPDDDPDFLRELDRRIKGGPDGEAE